MFGYRYKANVRDSHWRGAGVVRGIKKKPSKLRPRPVISIFTTL